MDRYAIFVDAGYVYAAGGDLVLDAPNRHEVKLDHARLIARLRETVDHDFRDSGDFLRVYWYDAAPRGIAQPEHDTIAASAGVKVRLGRLTRQGQKGVDSLVLRDMMRLSAEHAICTAFLFAGDEDLRQGVIEAQDYGVKVVLFGVEPTFGQNQAESLVQEADGRRIFSYGELEDCFSRARQDMGAVSLDESFDAYAIGFAFGEDRAEGLSPTEALKLADGKFIPRDVDAELIRRLLEIGDLPPSAQFPDAVLALARDGFRAALRSPTALEIPQEPLVKAVELPRAAVALVAPAAPGPISKLPAASPVAEPPETPPDTQRWSFVEGAAFGQSWLNEQPPDEVRYVRANFPLLPRDIDIELLRRLVRVMDLPPGGLIDDDDRRAARAGFWQALGMELDFGAARPASRGFEPITEGDPLAFGREFARQWAERSDPADVERARSLLTKGVGLPNDADGAMLRFASRKFGDPVPVDLRHRLRQGFREWFDTH